MLAKCKFLSSAVLVYSLGRIEPIGMNIFFFLRRDDFQEFPGGPVLRIPCFHCQARVRSLAGELRSHKPCGTAKKTKRDDFL